MGKKRKALYKVISVDNDREILDFIQNKLTGAGYDVISCFGVEKAIRALEFSTIDLVIAENNMPVIKGMDLLRYVKENFNDIEMMITGLSDVDGAVNAIKGGAEEYLVKPFSESELLEAVLRMVDKLERNRMIQSDPAKTISHGIIGQCSEIKEVFNLIDKAAKTIANTIVRGESGTGKELVARAIHYSSDRSSLPFVSVNCTAIPDTLLESELFGHVKGAFTGAKDFRAGFFQIADGGTIFLDEIGDASLSMQGKLLRVIQNKEIHLVGSSKVRKVDARIIAATNNDLKAMIKKGLFREDLYYRLNVINIPVPPLHERGDDILLLVNYFTEKFSKEMNRSPHMFSDKSLQALMNYNWPGNVRELENLIQRLVVIVDGDIIRVADMPQHMRYNVNRNSLIHRTLAKVEAEHISDVLTAVGGNKSKASEILGINRKTLRLKLQKIKNGS